MSTFLQLDSRYIELLWKNIPHTLWDHSGRGLASYPVCFHGLGTRLTQVPPPRSGEGSWARGQEKVALQRHAFPLKDNSGVQVCSRLCSQDLMPICTSSWRETLQILFFLSSFSQYAHMDGTSPMPGLRFSPFQCYHPACFDRSSSLSAPCVWSVDVIQCWHL